MSTKEEVRARLNIADIIGEHVHLTPTGPQRLKGLCPFHQEKTPSFHVDTERGYYHCFGCKASGDVFNFVQEIENLSFTDALQKLAERAGVQLEASYGTHGTKSRDLYDINALALAYFREHLQGAVLAYLAERQVSSHSMEAFELGFAPQAWDGLLQRAKARGVTEKQLLEAGLLSENTKTGRLYDRFRGRLMFPIRDHLDRLVGFGGRVLDDQSGPKYLNSPETPVFKKSELLYGLNVARQQLSLTNLTAEADKTGKADKADLELLVVEGYMDVIALHQHGFKQAVASLGTALTAEHASLLERLGVQRLNLLFDHDEAGQKATLSGLDQVLGARIRVRASRLEEPHKDPADALRAGDLASIQKALDTGQDEARYRVQAAIERFGIETNDGKRGILNALLPRMHNLDPLDEGAEYMRRMVCQMLGIKPEALLEWLGSKARRKQLTNTHVQGMSTDSNRSKDDEHELFLLRQVLINPQTIHQIDPSTNWNNKTVGKIMMIAQELSHPEDLHEVFRGKPEEQLIIRLLFENKEVGTISTANTNSFQERAELYAAAAVEDIQVAMSIESMQATIAELTQRLTTCEAGDSEGQMALLRRIQGLRQAIEAEKRLRQSQISTELW